MPLYFPCGKRPGIAAKKRSSLKFFKCFHNVFACYILRYFQATHYHRPTETLLWIITREHCLEASARICNPFREPTNRFPARLHRLTEAIPWNRFLISLNRQATQPCGIGFVESILGLPKSLRIPAQEILSSAFLIPWPVDSSPPSRYIPPTLGPREYWMIYTVPGLFAVIWLGSSLTPSLLPLPSIRWIGDTQEDWDREGQVADGRGEKGGGRGAQS